NLQSLSPDEQRLFRLYGKLPNKKDLLQNKLKERKYFDSGDYALSKAGKASDIGVTQIGREHPVPENIPHSSSPHNGPGSGAQGSISGINLPAPAPGSTPGQSGSPVKEGSFLHRETSLNRETSVDDDDEANEDEEKKEDEK
ncbi:Endosulfine-domain-containing protein, partial [Pseudovirgaria hyperparasitica]